MSKPKTSAQLSHQMIEWLDGTLSGEAASEFKKHLESSPASKQRSERWQLLKATLATQSRTPLPLPLRKAPFSTIVTPQADHKASASHNRWQRIPWYLRATIEGTGVVALILIAISAGPRLRTLYERSVERSLQEYGDLLVGDPSGKEGTPAAVKATDPSRTGEIHDDFAGEEDSDEAVESDSDDPTGTAAELAYITGDAGEKIRVGKSEIWRFMLKTDSPSELRKRVVSTLTDLGISKDTPDFGGTLAPGGIQFDLALSPAQVVRIKPALQRLMATRGSEAQVNESFTWYKSRSRRKIADGKVRVVIWLSQI